MATWGPLFCVLLWLFYSSPSLPSPIMLFNNSNEDQWFFISATLWQWSGPCHQGTGYSRVRVASSIKGSRTRAEHSCDMMTPWRSVARRSWSASCADGVSRFSTAEHHGRFPCVPKRMATSCNLNCMGLRQGISVDDMMIGTVWGANNYNNLHAMITDYNTQQPLHPSPEFRHLWRKPCSTRNNVCLILLLPADPQQNWISLLFLNARYYLSLFFKGGEGAKTVFNNEKIWKMTIYA